MTPNNKKALMITSSPGMASAIRAALDRHLIEIDITYQALNSIAVIRDAYNKTGNTVFIRKAFSRLVAEHGMPILLIIDYRIFLTSNLKDDPDMRKILRTFLISYLVLQKEMSAPAPAHIILIDAGEKGSGAKEAAENPVGLLDILSTDNVEINAMVAAYRKDNKRFNDQFKFIALSPREEGTQTLSRLEEFITRIFAAEVEKTGNAGKKNQGAVFTEKPAPGAGKPSQETNYSIQDCHVAVKTAADTAIIDGVERPLPSDDIYTSLRDGEIYVLGNWNRNNQKDIAEKILSAAASSACGNQLKKDRELAINLSLKCVIDSSIISSLFSMVTGELSDYRKLKILVNFKNGAILEKSPGYNIIKDRIYHVY